MYVVYRKISCDIVNAYTIFLVRQLYNWLCLILTTSKLLFSTYYKFYIEIYGIVKYEN